MPPAAPFRGGVQYYYFTRGLVRALRRDGVLHGARASLVARARGQVGPDVAPCHEDEPGVRVGGRYEPARVAGEEELQDRQEALQVGLLVDREVEVSVGDRAQRLGEQ